MDARRHGRIFWALLGMVMVAAVLCGGSPAAADWVQEAKLTASDAEVDDAFGYWVAIDGDSAIVGASERYIPQGAGSAYIFDRSGTTWTQSIKLTALDGAAQDGFGFAVDISGDRAIVGAWYDDDLGNRSGSAYIFERAGGVWAQAAKLTASDGAAGGLFGARVSISGDAAIVGGRWHDNASSTGTAYIFERAGGVWAETAKLTASDAVNTDWFGYSVTIEGDTAMVGSTGAGNNGPGSAYVFDKPAGGWTDMTQTAKLTASDGAAGDEFGFSVAVAGDTIAVGALWDNNAGGSDAGAAYVYERDGADWTEAAKLMAADGAGGDNLGVSVDIDGGVVVAGARYDDDDGDKSGSAYVFGEDGGVWTELAKLTADDAMAGDEMGWSVGISDGTVIVGALYDDHVRSNAGAAYIFTPEPGSLALLGLGVAGLLRRRRHRAHR